MAQTPAGRWQQQESERLAARRAEVKRMTLEERMPIAKIAEVLGVHVRQIERDRRALGIAQPQAPKLSEDEKAELRRLVLEEEVPASIAVRMIGRSPSVLRSAFGRSLPRLTREEYGRRGGLVRKGNMILAQLGRRGLGETPMSQADVLLPDAMLRPQYRDQMTRKESA